MRNYIFENCRLHTVLNSNRILVMDNGNVAEYSDPIRLTQNAESMFSRMLAQQRKGGMDH
jgi:ABC-type multidrug transport system fused ATPase/permease subunit